jgi:predicted acyltransferase
MAHYTAPAVSAATVAQSERLSAAGEGSRLMSVDALRGFDMFWILGGDLICRALPKISDNRFTRGLAAQMEHCEWVGFHFYDLIFPLFVFLVGVSIPFSLPKLMERRDKPILAKRILARALALTLIFLYYSSAVASGIHIRFEVIGIAAVLALALIQLGERSDKAMALNRIFVRSFILYLLGVFYMGGVASGFKNVYFAGVLHRISVAYFFAALLFCFLRTRALVIVCAGLLAGYWALMTFVPAPGMDISDLSVPGKNFANWIDRHYMPGVRFEGTILSTMAAVANCMLGIFTGLLLKTERVQPEKKVLWLLGSGVVSLAIGFAWAKQFPIIKLLWTSTYVLVACGYSALLLAAFYQIIEIWKWQRWAQPFVWIGMNAITIYIVANVVLFRKIAARFVGGDIERFFGKYDDLVLAVVTVLLALWLVRFLYQRKLFLRL